MLTSKVIRTVCIALLWVLLGTLAACGATRWEDEESSGRNSSSSQGTVGRTPSSVDVTVPPAATTARPVTVSSLLNDYYLDWRGTPYQFGGTTRRGIDCSALTQQAMNQALGISLPRTTREQLKQGLPVAAELTRPGDLVFFKTGETLNHVGVIVGPAKFMHASTRNGVTISRLDDTYWSARVIGYRRVIR